MGHYYIENDVDLEKYPMLEEECRIREGYQITFGDLHGNAWKFLYLLITHGFLRLEKGAEDYSSFVEAYKLGNGGVEENKRVKSIVDDVIQRATVGPPLKGALLRLLGDELCDRGQNDYFVLKLLEKLHKGNVPFEILVSDHGVEFLKGCLEKEGCYVNSRLAFGWDQSISFWGLMFYIDYDLVSKEEVKEMIETFYLPHLKLLSYSLGDMATSCKEAQAFPITIYSHAPIGLKNITHIACQLRLDPRVSIDKLGEGNIIAWATLIDGINEVFQKTPLLTKQRLEELFPVHQALVENKIMNCAIADKMSEEYPLVHLAWNRNYKHLLRPSVIAFVHGHDPNDTDSKNIYSLDDSLGKTQQQKGTQYHEKGAYRILYSNDFLSFGSALKKENSLKACADKEASALGGEESGTILFSSKNVRKIRERKQSLVEEGFPFKIKSHL